MFAQVSVVDRWWRIGEGEKFFSDLSFSLNLNGFLFESV
jgi:hypothetical protein